MNKKRVLIIIVAIAIIIIVRWQEKANALQGEDACLCTEVLSNELLLSREQPLEVVKECKELFTNFEKAHGKCIEALPAEHPEIIIDSLKNI